jgi:hypothetical protein
MVPYGRKVVLSILTGAAGIGRWEGIDSRAQGVAAAIAARDAHGNMLSGEGTWGLVAGHVGCGEGKDVEFPDYLQITNLLHQYAHLMDQADFDGVGRLFAHADVYMPGEAGIFRKDALGVASLFRRWNRVYADTGTLRTRHITTNLILEDDGPDRARGRCYVLVVQATPDFPLQPVIAGTYEDRFERVEGVWRFSERREEFKNFELVGDLSAHLAIDYKPTPGTGG